MLASYLGLWGTYGNLLLISRRKGGGCLEREDCHFTLKLHFCPAPLPIKKGFHLTLKDPTDIAHKMEITIFMAAPYPCCAPKRTIFYHLYTVPLCLNWAACPCTLLWHFLQPACIILHTVLKPWRCRQHVPVTYWCTLTRLHCHSPHPVLFHIANVRKANNY